ncbi:MAG: DUF4080 domain-containing protein, partial [Desulfuromonadales bacterium]|nr:DUF4080 domain-containing protein [Desulfuromonadales bacterium]
LLLAWQQDVKPELIPRTVVRQHDTLISGPDSPPIANLDNIPSPFQLGLCDLTRGFAYYETSRGCPFHCSFCLSARDNLMRSYSMERIQDDLLLLMQNEVPKVKLVDRTFNYDAKRAREIFRFILEHNRSTHFHFEIGAHLLDDATLALLETVAHDTFQFEIGVQSTLESTLGAINRKVNLGKLEENVRRLVTDGRIHLHLDLIAGLPGENFGDLIASIDRVMALKPHHLQIEPVKLLPGSPLREQAEALRIRFDPNPPYTTLGSPELSYAQLQQIQKISRLLDLTFNSGCFATFLNELTDATGSFAKGLVWLAGEWHRHDLFRYPMSRQEIFNNLVKITEQRDNDISRQRLLESLAYDYARCEKVITSRIPAFFDTGLNPAEQRWMKEVVQKRTDEIKGQGIKLQYFAAVFSTLHNAMRRSVYLFLYLTQTGKKMQVEEYHFYQQQIL